MRAWRRDVAAWLFGLALGSAWQAVGVARAISAADAPTVTGTADPWHKPAP